MPVSNTYVEPTSGTTLNLARQQFNDSMRAVLTNFKGPAIPTNLKADDVLFSTQQDGMLYRSTVTNALYILDTANKQANNIGGGFTRWGIAARVEPTVASLTSRANLSNFYETGEIVVTLDTGRLYVKNGITNTFGSFADVGNPVGYTVEATTSNITFTGSSVRATQFLASSNVGINKTVPAVALDVVGSATISTTLQANLVSAASYQTFLSDYSAASWTTAGPAFNARARIYIDTSSASGTVVNPRTSFSIAAPTFNAAIATVTLSNASAMYISAAPIAGANTVIINPHALHIGAGRVYNEGAGSATIPAYAVRTANTGIFSPTTTSLGISVLGNTAATFDSLGRFITTTISSNVSTSNITFTGTSVMKGDFSTTSGVTTTAAIDSIAANAYTPSPIGGNIKTLVNNNSSTAVTFNAPSANGDYTMVVQVTNGTVPGAITLAGFTKTQGSGFTTTAGHVFLVYITKIGDTPGIKTFANVVALQ